MIHWNDRVQLRCHRAAHAERNTTAELDFSIFEHPRASINIDIDAS
jgi:hypothetical protein